MSAPSSPVVAYLGGSGSFSEEACRRFMPAHDLMPLGDFAAVARAVRQGSADVGVLPISNSLAGPIAAVRTLLAHPELRVIGEQMLDVRLHLLGTPDASLQAIRHVSSHRAALLQCQRFLAERPWSTNATTSTAEAARQVAAAADSAIAAIGSATAARIYGLRVLARDLQDEADNVTRFAIVERRDQFA